METNTNTEEALAQSSKKIKKKIRIRQQVVIFLLTAVSIAAAALIVGLIIQKSAVSRANAAMEDVIKEQADYLTDLLQAEGTAADEKNPAVDCMYTMAHALSGRILVIDNSYRITLDTYDEKDDRYLIDNTVHEIMTSGGSKILKQSDYIRYIFPISDENQEIEAVVVMTMDVSQNSGIADILKNQCDMLVIIFIIIGVVIGFAVAYLSIRDIRKLKLQLANMKGGFLSQLEIHNVFREIDELTQNINGIFAKAQMLEDSRQEFVSNVSHELKTPITSMKVLSESLMTQENVPVETYREFMNDIVQEIDREAQIISDLLTLVKTDKGSDSLNFENVDINALMEVILKRLKPLAEKRNIEVTYESFREVNADIDKVKFTLAISNLIENGIKYNIDGGWIRVSLNADHKNLYIKVADSGVGIPEDCVEHIFERFYRVDKARSRDTGGTGLGLAISKNIIVMHKGTINVYSEPGKGTTFTVRVPMNYIK